MKPVKGLAGLMLVGLFVLSSATLTWAQSQNRQALRWFENAVREKNVEKKINAYERAIEFDPHFVEALLNLGLVYKKQRDYRRGHEYLLRAYTADPDRVSMELKQRILLELAITYRHLGKLADCEEALRGAKNLSGDRQIVASVSFELGRVLYEQGKYAEAIAELEDGAKLATSNAASFDNLMKIVNNGMRLQTLYDKAVMATNQGDIERAQGLYEQILATSPNFSDARARLASLQDDARKKSNEQELAAIYQQAKQHADRGEYDQAIPLFEQIVQTEGNYRDTLAALKEAKEKSASQNKARKIEAEYAAGISALQTRDWTRAIMAFQNVVDVNPSYRQAKSKLAQAEENLDRESLESTMSRNYAEAINALKHSDLAAALRILKRIHRMDPTYRDVGARISRVEQQMEAETVPVERATVASQTPAGPSIADSIYTSALAAMQSEDWEGAVAMLEQLDAAFPGFKDTRALLVSARANNAYRQGAQERFNPATAAGNKMVYYMGGAFALLVLAPSLFLTFSPASRARLHMLRGNYTRAAAIYERLIDMHPGRLKLYSTLANLYLLTGKTDDRALKIFKMVLQLNIAAHRHEEISTIVKQSYLNEGHGGPDRIGLLEKALRSGQTSQTAESGEGT